MDDKIEKLSSPSAVAAKLLDAGLRGDKRRLELVTLTVIRQLKNSEPELGEQLAKILNKHRMGGATRQLMVDPPPTDLESTLSLLKVESDIEDASEPVLSQDISEQVVRFVRERQEADRLISKGFLPPASLLLCGPPGTGKTMLAHWIAKELNLKLATLDLATSISSLLGKTGANLRRILDYARATPTLLLLDEFDSVAKRRDDQSDIGELKRVVNVLLKELEDWPETSVLIAATNHPELLDPATFRRFDRVIDLALPGNGEIQKILQDSMGGFSGELKPALIEALAILAEGYSGARIFQLGQASVRRHIVGGESLECALLSEFGSLATKKMVPKERAALLRKIKDSLGDKISLRILADAFGLSISTIHYHLDKE